MGIYEFNILPIEGQCETLFSEGDFVGSISRGKFRFALYALYRFWIEVTYDSETNRIVRINSFISGRLLDRYSGFQDPYK